MADPIWESSLKSRLNTNYCDISCCKIKSWQISVEPKKQLQVCFPLAAWHSSLNEFCISVIEQNIFILGAILLNAFSLSAILPIASKCHSVECQMSFCWMPNVILLNVKCHSVECQMSFCWMSNVILMSVLPLNALSCHNS